MSEALLPQTVAIIGSFRQQYEQVLGDWHTFTDSGLVVTSPKGAPIVEPGIDFVRFESDNPDLTDDQIEQIALHRILRADFVYAELPDGYIGRTTCLEIGRVLDRNRPLYFSERPADLPIEVPETHVAKAAELVARFRKEMPRPLVEALTGVSRELEQNLVEGNYLDL
jgi:hypothetical protein